MIKSMAQGCGVVATAAAVALALHGAALAQTNAPAAPAQPCPTNAQSIEQPIECVCTVIATEADSQAWGTDVYTNDSSICRAARHAGSVGAGGGVVRVTPLPGQQSYPGSERNGVTTADYGDWNRSFSVAAGTAATAIDLNQCPADFQGLRGRSEVISCMCSAEQAAEGLVRGSDIYTDDSSICRAAVHAGAIPSSGGPVRLQPEPSQKSYMGSERNGVTTEDYGEWQGSFSFAR